MSAYRSIGSLVLFSLLTVGAASVAKAQQQPDWQATPTYTTVELRAGFTPDPWTINLDAGGFDRVRGLGRDCTGYINNAAPDVDLNYDRGSGILSLYIQAQSSADTTLVILDPDGNWHCNDDAIGLNPMVVFERPKSGNYNIWVGTVGSDLAPAQLLISELHPDARGGSAGMGGVQPNWRANPTYTTATLRAGFTPDPWTHNIQAGGADDISASVGGECTGFINARAPDVDLNYDHGSGVLSLYIHVESRADTTIAVLDPDGTWHCNDDAIGLNPMVTFRRPLSGNYNIWVGTFSSGKLEPARLFITELNPVR